jgi:hypothetical protein
MNYLKEIKSIYVYKIEQWEKEIRAFARILEDISLPSRLILEHILELKNKSGLMALEAESVHQGFVSINEVGVEEFGVIRVSAGTIELAWRDAEYNYLLYPDKVELRTIDEKAVIKLFFSQNFGRQLLHSFSAVTDSPPITLYSP